jgi:hypothetical protein
MFRTLLAHLQEGWSRDVFPHPVPQPTSTTAHNSHQTSVSVVPSEDGQVMPKICRDIESY